MRSLAAVVVVASCLFASTAFAAGGCGFGCHSTVEGACVVDGWETGAFVRNECPAFARPQPPCGRYYSWRRHGRTCLRLN